MSDYPRRLIEVDLPIKTISAHARREKSIRHGHISTLHIWWARRPLAACRAVLCAALWPDPLDERCPQAFRDLAALALNAFAEQVRSDPKLAKLCADHWTRWVRTTPATLRGDQPASWADLRYGLLDFIADFANWDASTVPSFLETARVLTHVAHLVLTNADFRLPIVDPHHPQSAIKNLQSQIKNLPRPLVVDPFAGGGSIPLEALRIGADAFASDLNPVAVLLNKVVLEYIPKYGNARIEGRDSEGNPIVFNGLAEAVRYWGNWIKEQAEKELAEFYPKDPDGATPIAYLWARNIICEGPGCGAEVPLMRSFWLAKKTNRSVAIVLIPDQRQKLIEIQVVENANPKEVGMGTVRRGSATCPLCGYTTPLEHVREQLRIRRGGTNDSRLLAVILESNTEGTRYRIPTESDYQAILDAKNKLLTIYPLEIGDGVLMGVPNEPTPSNKSHRAVGSPMIYGMTEWGDLFTVRQNLSLLTLSRFIHELPDDEALQSVKVILGLCASKLAGFLSSLCMWRITRTCVAQTFTRQALAQVWDFGEMNPFAGSAGDWSEAVRYVALLIDHVQTSVQFPGSTELANALSLPLPDDFAEVYMTDPPYYDSVAYAELSDFFYVWLKRGIGSTSRLFFQEDLTPKQEQAVVLHPNSAEEKSDFERKMSRALFDGRRVLRPNGIGLVVFAHKSTTGWEAQLQAIINAGWTITGSWPIDTERGGRVNAQDTASLASSIHLVCRPRETADGSILEAVGDWRDVLQALPGRIHEWLPRLAREGIVGADAIFACLGPALEIFSRYSRVEKANGDPVPLKEYLEHVWAAVSREALGVIFDGADASGFEEDARLTAMWLWTLKAENGNGAAKSAEAADEEEGSELEKPLASLGAYSLEYDAARKIAQGLGAHLDKLESLVEVKGDKARLRSARERARFLFGKDDNSLSGKSKPKADVAQLSLFSLVDGAEPAAGEWKEAPAFNAGNTVLDCIHQAMLLFGYGRGEALKRFLVDQGIGREARFWRLAQALSALYPSGSDEKRWVDGVLARKKGLGF